MVLTLAFKVRGHELCLTEIIPVLLLSPLPPRKTPAFTHLLLPSH